MTLYVKTGCPYSEKVFKALHTLGIDDQVRRKNVAESGVVEELIALGGKKRSPFLVDEAHGVSMYESSDIIKHLCKYYGGDPALLDTTVEHHVCEAW